MDNILHNLKFETIVGNLQGAEGPVFTKNGSLFMVAPEVEIDKKPAGQVLKIDTENKTAVVVSSPSINGYGGIPAGCQSDKDNNIWIADMRHGLLKMSPDYVLSQVCKVDNTKSPMQGCNDCIFDYDGSLWITAPAGEVAPSEYLRSMSEAFGSVYCFINGEMMKVDTGYIFCNGIAVQHSEDDKPVRLIVAETGTKTLWAFDITGPGIINNKHKWGEVPGDHVGGPDGMDFDDDGNLLVANWGSSHIEVFSPSGKLIQRIKCPFAKISNIHFRPNSNELFITEHDNHALWKILWNCKGKKQFCEM